MNSDTEFSRTERMLGTQSVQKLQNKTVAVFGIGGVGSFAAEALARTGIGTLFLIDKDCVSITNINRQLIALHSTLGKPKVAVMKSRIFDINPKATVFAVQEFFCSETINQFDFTKFDYIVDAIDTISAKILLVQTAYNLHIPIISSMGAGNKLHPELFEITDIYKTSVCPLARIMRTELRKKNIPSLPVVYSRENPIPHKSFNENETIPKGKHVLPGSISFVPSAVGLILAGEVIRNLLAHE